MSTASGEQLQGLLGPGEFFHVLLLRVAEVRVAHYTGRIHPGRSRVLDEVIRIRLPDDDQGLALWDLSRGSNRPGNPGVGLCCERERGSCSERNYPP